MHKHRDRTTNCKIIQIFVRGIEPATRSAADDCRATALNVSSIYYDIAFEMIVYIVNWHSFI